MMQHRSTKCIANGKLGSLGLLSALSQRIGWGLLATGLLCGSSLRLDWSSAVAGPDPASLLAFKSTGCSSVAVGAPYEDVGGISNAGQAHALESIHAGSVTTLVNSVPPFFNQDSEDSQYHPIEDLVENSDTFGYALAIGDFDTDGYDDLAIGVPFDNFGGFEDVGGVNVMYGSSPNGLTDSGDQLINQDSSGVRDACGTWDHFGYALAAGDFNGDGEDDLAVGVPGENADGLTDSGIVQELYGTFAGLVGADRPIWTASTPQESAQFGKSMVVGDFDGNGYDDLAVGAPDMDIDTDADIGVVSIIYGTPVGLGSTGRQLWHQDNVRVAANEAGDQFGYSLAAGDFNCDLIDDLVIGIPYEDVGSVEEAGMLIEMHGTTFGLSDSAARMWYQGDSGIGDTTETSDHFAWSLASIRIDWNMLFLPVTRR